MLVQEEILETPLGKMRAEFDSEGTLTQLLFLDRELLKTVTPEVSPRDSGLGKQLGEYFAELRPNFEWRLAPAGTDFQKNVWEELRRIPCGETISYAELARRIGDPGAVRAVARANALNPIAILIPCHRVIGSDGSLTGYAGGLERKARLLSLEAAMCPKAGAQIGLF
ncbi:MAG: methylated-DNA--[protein]-cysteine S-methyltransferase [Deltaproteobacteria bacterium]|nr:methylated-DNA--[protein]-cysteine S-methyltransferase [Deltaproteobacteria bacterium]